MKNMRFYPWLAIAGLLLLTQVSGIAQTGQATSPAPAAGTGQSATHSATTAPAVAAPAASASQTAAPLSPHAQLILADTDKLVDLVQQLKTEMDKSSQDVLSLDTIHKAEDIEKLAKELEKQLEHAKK